MRNQVTSVPLRIEFKQTGGIVGGAWTATVDTAALSPEEARELAELVERADFFGLPAPRFRPFSSLTVDAFEYDITVTWGAKRRRIRVDDTSVSPNLWPLISRLGGIAR